MSNAWKPLGGILTNLCLISLLDLRLLLDRLLLIPLCLSLNPSLLGLNQKIVRLSNVIEAPSVLCTVKCIVAVSNCSHLYFVIGKLSCHHLSRVLCNHITNSGSFLSSLIQVGIILNGLRRHGITACQIPLLEL